jgi:hypothetical protein
MVEAWLCISLILLGTQSRAASLMSAQGPTLCSQSLQLRTINGMDFGDVRVRAQESGFVSVATDGAVLKSDNVLVRHDPTAAVIDVCGKPNQAMTIVIKTAEVAVKVLEGDRTTKRINRFVIKGQGMTLEYLGAERWEGKLGASGRATLLVGATLVFKANSLQGTFVSNVALFILDAAALDVPITGDSELAMEVNCPIPLNFGVVSIPDKNAAGTVMVAANLGGGVTSPFLVTGYQRARCDITYVSKLAEVVISGGNGIWNSNTRQLNGAKLVNDRSTLGVVIEIERNSVGGPAQEVPVVPIYIGGSLNIPANFTAFGTYTRTFTITVTE